KISQQLVSKFENRGGKSIPRWLGYVQRAMAIDMHERGIDTEGLWALRLPRELQRFFQSQIQHQNRLSELEQFAEEDDVTSEERGWLDLLRQLDREDRRALLRLARSLAARPAGTTLHDRSHTYRGEG
ncbi:MAG: hypothetical protein WCZ28_11260, partial [Burkholderiaceae bacterium]